jgi:hypothetical protein
MHWVPAGELSSIENIAILDLVPVSSLLSGPNLHILLLSGERP